MRLTEKVSSWCNLSGHSKTEVANALGIAPNTLTSRLAGKTDWTWSEACKLSALMDTPLDELAGR